MDTINCKISSIKIMLSFLGVVVESVLSYPVCLKQVVVVDLSLEAWLLRLMINRVLTMLFILVYCSWKCLQSSNTLLIVIHGLNILQTNSCQNDYNCSMVLICTVSSINWYYQFLGFVMKSVLSWPVCTVWIVVVDFSVSGSLIAPTSDRDSCLLFWSKDYLCWWLTTVN